MQDTRKKVHGASNGVKLTTITTSIILFLPVLATADTIIRMTANGFEPASVTITGSDRVVIFKNDDTKAHWPASNVHPTHRLYPGTDIKKCGTAEGKNMFDSCGPVKSGESYVFEMNSPGDWTYHDHENPEFTGNIVIVGSSTEKKTSVSLWTSFSRAISRAFTRFFYTLQPGRLEKDLTSADMIALAEKDGAGIRKWIEIIGTTKVMTKMNDQKMSTGRDCHQPAHAVGRQSYEVYGDKVFSLCSAECHSGCYHGAAEAYFREHGASNLEKDLGVICGGSLNAFFSHQCLHGVGHGLTAWSGYDIFKALSSCDLLSVQRDSCYTGVFMENIVGGLAAEHKTKYLNDDPQYPCTIVPEKYKSSCYFLQTSRMMVLFAGDFKKIAKACGQAPAEYRQACFQSMGRDVGGVKRGDPAGAIAACSYATGKNRSDCLSGAIKDTFWDASGADTGLNFCRTLTSREDKMLCYSLQFTRAPQVFTSQSDIKNFCDKAEKEYQHLCQDL